MKMLRTSRQASRKNSATPVHPEAGSARLILINWSVYQPPVSDKRLVGPAKEWQKQRPVMGAERLGNGFDVGGLPRRVAEVRQQGDNHAGIRTDDQLPGSADGASAMFRLLGFPFRVSQSAAAGSIIRKPGAANDVCDICRKEFRQGTRERPEWTRHRARQLERTVSHERWRAPRKPPQAGV